MKLIELEDDWKQAYKFLSMWGIVILGCIPQLWNLAIDNHLIDASQVSEGFSHLVNFVAFLTAAGRLVKQRFKAQEAKKS